MSIFNLSDVLTFFMTIGIALIFVAIWTVASERKRKILKDEVKKLRSQIESYEREKFILLEKIDILENTQSSPDQNAWAGNSAELERRIEEEREKISVLQAENNKLKKELTEAKSSLEEVYKALS